MTTTTKTRPNPYERYWAVTVHGVVTGSRYDMVIDVPEGDPYEWGRCFSTEDLAKQHLKNLPTTYRDSDKQIPYELHLVDWKGFVA